MRCSFVAGEMQFLVVTTWARDPLRVEFPSKMKLGETLALASKRRHFFSVDAASVCPCPRPLIRFVFDFERNKIAYHDERNERIPESFIASRISSRMDAGVQIRWRLRLLDGHAEEERSDEAVDRRTRRKVQISA